MKNKLFLSPHDDDQALFGAFTLMREQPLVAIVTDAYKQQNRGENISPELRAHETTEAMKIFGLPHVRMGIRDDILTEGALQFAFRQFKGFDLVYAPAMQGGNPHHDLIGKIARQVFSCPVVWYATYSDKELYTTGNIEVVPSNQGLALKDKALSCYESQINLPATAPHFEAVKGRSEWYI